MEIISLLSIYRTSILLAYKLLFHDLKCNDAVAVNEMERDF